MDLDLLKSRYPLEKATELYFLNTINTTKDLLQQTVASQMKMQLPEKALSEICQIYFYLAVNIESLLSPGYKTGIDLVKRNFSNQLKTFQNHLHSVALNSIKRGVPKDYIIEYLCMYFENTHKQIFPDQPLIL